MLAAMESLETFGLMTIGRFSRLTGLSVKALRHYDELGLLRPAAVDGQTGYRSYSSAQPSAACHGLAPRPQVSGRRCLSLSLPACPDLPRSLVALALRPAVVQSGKRRTS